MEFAFDEANRRHVPLEAVTCWRPRRMSSTSLVDRLVVGAESAAEEWLSLSLRD